LKRAFTGGEEMRMDPGLSTLEYLRGLYAGLAPKYAFERGWASDPARWKLEFSEALVRLLGGFPEPECELNPEFCDVTELDDHTRTRVTVETEPGVRMPCYLLMPKEPAGTRRPAVIAQHGHGRGKDDVAGVWASDEDRRRIAQDNYDYGLQLVKRGYCVLCPDARGFGERREPEDIASGRQSCRQGALNALLLGKTILGLKVWDVARAIDYLQSLPEVDPERIGMVGLSMGGTITLFTSALEPRIKAAVVSGYFCTFADSIMAMEHCECNYVPGILRLGEMHDVAGLMAPTPLLVESGEKDEIFPFEAARLAFQKLSAIYQAAGAADRPEADFHPGGHRFSGAKAFDFLARWLRA
jgi:dienelactone hydrolase